MDSLLKKIEELYKNSGCIHIFNHSLNVADKAVELANIFKVDSVIVNNVYIAALLHDIGGIYPNNQRISIAKQYNIELLDEEYTFPLIIHQKISRYIAEKYFEIKDTNILDSIECHTTLREHYRIEDLIVFLADKIAWDQKGIPPYLDDLLKKLQSSLEEAALFYIDYILIHGIKVIHPWLLNAKKELKKNIIKGDITRMANKIYGPQSIITIYENENKKVIRKVATERGKQDLIDQVEFYKNLPDKIKYIFPQMINYNIDTDPFFLEYEYIDYTQLRVLLVNNKLSYFWLDKLSNCIIDMMKSVHSLIRTDGNIEYANELYINRCINRVNETKSMLNNKLLNMKIILNNIEYEPIIDKSIDLFKTNIHKLIPEYICSTHGQLGPAHIFLSKNDNNYKLIDPKGFDNLHDPVIDLCKIGKAMLYGTEWLEEENYILKYHIKDNSIYIDEFQINNFDFDLMKKKYNYFLEKIADEISINNLNKRLLYMILADLIGGLPFAYKTNGEERVIALLLLIQFAYKDILNMLG